MTAKVLMFVAEPSEQARLQCGREYKEIDQRLRMSKLRDHWNVKYHPATEAGDLPTQILHEKPLVVHFSGHGTGAGGLALEDEAGRLQPVSTEALEDLFRLFAGKVACVVLNACFSATQAEVIAAHIPYVVGMHHEIKDDAAIDFAVGFYTALFDGESIDRAFEFGRNAILLESLPDPIRGGWTTRLLSTGGVRPIQTLPEHLKPVLLGRRGPVQGLPAADARAEPDRETGPDPIVVDRFKIEFQRRKRQLQFMEAHKQFHAVLHELQAFQPQIVRAVAGLTRPSPEGPSPQSVADSLEDWREVARRAVEETEFPDRPPRWIQDFERSTTDLVAGLTPTAAGAPPAERIARAVAVLGNLPAKVQVDLNEDLLNFAIRLNTADLINLMDELLPRLTGRRAENLRRRTEAFRNLCKELGGLIEDHDHCQKVDGAVQEAAGMAGQSGGAPAGWDEVCGRLEAIAAARPKSPYARKAAESARRFGEVVNDPKQAAEVLALFRERFEKLFLQTDEDLLELTKDLVAAAGTLDDALGGYSE